MSRGGLATQPRGVLPPRLTVESAETGPLVAAPAWQLKLFLAIVAASIVGYVAYVISFGVNVVFWDDWAWAGFAAHPWQISFGNLWTQHTENIVFFPNVLAAVLIPLTHWNSLAFMGLSAGMLVGVLAITLRVLWHEILKSPLRWLPLPLLVLGLAQYQNTLWAYQIAWFMILLALFGAVALLIRPDLTATPFICAAVLGVVGSYSSFEGLLIWPVGLVVLLSKGCPARWRIAWCTIGALVTAGFFAGYSWHETGSASLVYILSHLALVAEGVLITTGSVIPTMASGVGAISSPVIAEIVGAILLGSSVGVIASWIRRGRPSGASAFCVALIVTSILFAVSLVPSRLVYAPSYGSSSRYDTFVWPLLLGTYSYVAMSAPRPLKMGRMALLPQMFLAFAVGSALVVGSIVGIDQGQTTRTVRVTAADVLANLPSAPTAVAAPYLLPPCAFQAAECRWLSAETRAIAAQRMSIFNDPGEIEHLRALGIEPDGVAHRLLPVPRTLWAQVNASPTSHAAWAVLSAAYWSDSALQMRYPRTLLDTAHLLAWAIATGDTVNAQTVMDDAWLPPESDAFFLVQYRSIYRSWEPSGTS